MSRSVLEEEKKLVLDTSKMPFVIVTSVCVCIRASGGRSFR